MVEYSIIRHLLSDTESLSVYNQAEVVTFEDVRRRLFLLERFSNSMIPDQFYRLKLERDIKQNDSLDKLLVNGLADIAEEYLNITENKIYIQYNKQNEWQDIVTYLPPLLLKIAFLHKRIALTNIDKHTLFEYFTDYILPNTRYTSLPSAMVAELDNLVDTANGLHDLHIHLNGATELDIMWQDFLTYPDKIYKEFKNATHIPFVKEQLEQESTLLDPLKFYNLLKIARRIRILFFNFIFPGISSRKSPSLKIILADLIASDRYSRELPDASNPFLSLFKSKIDLENNMPTEGLMYLLILENLSKNRNPTLASLFHFYLLIQGLANRLVVQQVQQKGFQQFQKITLNQLREFSEAKYHSRFFQMHGNDLKFLNFLEARFSPKENAVKNAVILNSISKGWDYFLNNANISNKITSIKPTLKLVSHFIKRLDTTPDTFIRHKKLRIDTWNRGKVLLLLMKNFSKYRNLIVGFDVASSEFDTPPEVFAPTFRSVREKFIEIKKAPHFTYHVGEDFFHLIGGMRAIYEAIEFLGLKENDRIGHGTAIGISAYQWKKIVEDSILIRQGEWLDNLIFMWSFTRSNSRYTTVLNSLEIEIRNLANKIYGSTSYTSIYDLEQAWLARKYCPILLFCDNEHDARIKTTYSSSEWQIIQSITLSTTVKNLVVLYHRIDIRKKYDKIISVKIADIFDLEYLEATQKAILSWMARKEIVIETLPTSNVRIGNYKNYKDYHLHNWFEWSKDISVPKIVVGTDDTGIFATNLYNEYANIWQYFTICKSEKPRDALKLIEELNENSVKYKFQ